MYGYSFDKPARHMREYLSVLVPLVRGEQVEFEGETLTAKIGLSTPARVTCRCSSPRWPRACSSSPARSPTAPCSG
nr:hypothetical protein GCM10020093_032350 [Planobispora longispora]